MPTITRKALEWLEDRLESQSSQIDDLEEELEKTLEENASLRAQLVRMRATLQAD